MDPTIPDNMDVDLLRVLCVVATERGFSKAARKLGRTQPAVSLAIRRLEEALGVTLIDRSANPLLLTDAGELAVRHALQLQNEMKRLSVALEELRDRSGGKLVIGANESTSQYLLPHVVKYRQRYPRVRVEIRRSLSSKIPEQLMSGDLELGVVAYNTGAGIESRVIYSDQLAFVVYPSHRFAKRKSVSVKELGMETFIAHSVDSPYREEVVRSFAAHRVPLNLDIEMPTVETVRTLVERGEGVSILPAKYVEESVSEGRLCQLDVPELRIPRKIRLISCEGRILSYAAKAFLDLVSSITSEQINTKRRESPKRKPVGLGHTTVPM